MDRPTAVIESTQLAAAVDALPRACAERFRSSGDEAKLIALMKQAEDRQRQRESATAAEGGPAVGSTKRGSEEAAASQSADEGSRSPLKRARRGPPSAQVSPPSAPGGARPRSPASPEPTPQRRDAGGARHFACFCTMAPLHTDRAHLIRISLTRFGCSDSPVPLTSSARKRARKGGGAGLRSSSRLHGHDGAKAAA